MTISCAGQGSDLFEHVSPLPALHVEYAFTHSGGAATRIRILYSACGTLYYHVDTYIIEVNVFTQQAKYESNTVLVSSLSAGRALATRKSQAGARKPLKRAMTHFLKIGLIKVRIGPL